MNNEERQQSLSKARNGYHFLRNYIESQIVDDRLRAEISCLLDEFDRLDRGEQKRNAAGRKYGKLGAEHGNKPPAPGKKLRGRPRKTNNEGKK